MEEIFILLLFFIFYTYLGYPLFLFCWSAIVKKKVKKRHDKPEPSISVIIAAKNEENNIKKRIKNLMDQNYPINRMEIIIISDGSEDNTNIIVQNIIKELTEFSLCKNNILKLIYYKHSHGKPYALNKGVKEAKGEIIVFADCRQSFSEDTIKQLTSNFNDEDVGCVSGELIFKETPISSIQNEMNSYWNFEKWLRKLESKTGSVPGATGAIYAIRKRLYRDIPERTLLDDVLIPLNIRKLGYRVVFDNSAIAYDYVSDDFFQEKKRKVRTLAGNWQLLIMQPSLISPLHNPLWFKFLSHKIFRLLIPHCLITLLVISFILNTLFSNIILILLVLFVILALIPSLPSQLGILSKISGICKSLFFLNYFAFIAPFKLIGTSKKLW